MTLLLHYNMTGERQWKISLAVRKKRRFSESGQRQSSVWLVKFVSVKTKQQR
jgi:hypothetical protein